jgi:hypothetical protein
VEETQLDTATSTTVGPCVRQVTAVLMCAMMHAVPHAASHPHLPSGLVRALPVVHVQLCDSGYAMEEGECIKCPRSGSLMVLRTPGVVVLAAVLPLLVLSIISMAALQCCKVHPTACCALPLAVLSVMPVRTLHTPSLLCSCECCPVLQQASHHRFCSKLHRGLARVRRMASSWTSVKLRIVVSFLQVDMHTACVRA